MGKEIDPWAAALRVRLEAAIADGRPVDAAALATELAARARVIDNAKVVPLAHPKLRRSHRGSSKRRAGEFALTKRPKPLF
jgi:hypothetical protein